MGPERGGEPRAPAACSFKELSSLFEMILVQFCNAGPSGAGLDGWGWSCKRTGKGLEQLCQGDKEEPSCREMLTEMETAPVQAGTVPAMSPPVPAAQCWGTVQSLLPTEAERTLDFRAHSWPPSARHCRGAAEALEHVTALQCCLGRNSTCPWGSASLV